MDLKEIIWHKVLDSKNELAEGRVMTVTAGHKTICLSHFKGKNVPWITNANIREAP